MWGCRWRENKWGASPFFLCKTGVDERDGVGKKSLKKSHKKEGVQPMNGCPSHKFFYVLFSLTQSFLRGFS